MYSAQGQLDTATQQLLRATVHATRANSLDLLARAVAAAVGVRFGMIGEIVEARSIRVRALSGAAASRVPQQYALSGTPCEEVSHTGFHHHSRDALKRFPKDPLLCGLGAQSYLGIPLRGLEGAPIGILAALHDQPTQPLAGLEEVLSLFGTRASAELERVRAEEELASSESRYRCIVSTCQEGIWWLDAQGKTLFANEPMFAMLGYGSQELAAIPLPRLLAPHERVRQVHDLVERAPGAGGVRDVRLRRRDGAEVWTQMTTSPMHDRSGAFEGVLAFVTDVSERRVLEQRALHAQKLQSLGLLAGGIAHDFNNLLLGIMGRAELVRSQLGPLHPANTDLDGIESAVDRAADLTRQLLAYAGKSQVRAQTIELGRTVDDMIALLSTVISKKTVIHVKHEERAFTFGDPAHISQIVMNLIMNASDAIEQDQGTIDITTGLHEADEKTLAAMYAETPLARGTYAYIAVRDTGKGMDAATKERIFEPFFSTKSTGRGLGLAAVVGILRLHRGAVGVVSEPDMGSTFTVFLPRATEAQRESAPPPEPLPIAPTASGVVLIADDEGEAREMCKRTLQEAGFQVLLAADGEEALRVFQAHQPVICAVVLDRAMPKLSGEQVYVEILRVRPDMPAVVSSGYAEQEMLPLFRGSAPLAFLTKPWRGANLLEAVRTVLARAGKGGCRSVSDDGAS